MAPSMDFELVIAGAGILRAFVAISLHSADLALACVLIAALADYATWLDQRD
jgi:hypothetical protein